MTIQNKVKQVELAEVLPIEQVKSLFQQVHSKATAEGLSKFKFTNKAGETKEYSTNLTPLSPAK